MALIQNQWDRIDKDWGVIRYYNSCNDYIGNLISLLGKHWKDDINLIIKNQARLTCKVKFGGNSIDLTKAEYDDNESMLAL